MQRVPMRNMITDFIGRGIAKVQVEMEREAQIASKNFEIVWLWDRLHYHDAVNQKNPEALELARREGKERKESRDVFGGSFAAVITVGTAALAVLSLNLIGAKHL
ncbi:hypothetical protein PVL29_026172 [Vitis rotundifolia]|uniref:Uncharacterized protein n=1 Tax=Vitis rotundifolia TaxID=103349 RepID=A0AA38YLZ8_VITRO|nr:hypothetical protein PVL29_026172 [Vitis rotundifolia]